MRDYERVVLHLFKKISRTGGDERPFTKDDLESACQTVGVPIKNIADILYTYRVRSSLPDQILKSGNWIIEGRGKSRYAFVKLSRAPYIDLPLALEVISIPDATPEIIQHYGGSDEQGLLARIRYNRLVDIFLGITTFQLQGHFRTTLKDIGQVEIDELYLGVDADGKWYVIPVEAKGPAHADRLGVIQVSWLAQFAKEKYPELLARPVGAKAWTDGSIFMIKLYPATKPEEVRAIQYKRYKLEQIADTQANRA